MSISITAHSFSVFRFPFSLFRSQRLHCLLQGSNLALCIGQFLALQFYHLCGGILYEALVGEFLLYSALDALQTCYLGLGLLYLSLGIDEVAQRY